ncbi:MAG: dethiobiotin synthase [bacterium]
MSKSFIIAGTDTNVGKTILSALLMSVDDSYEYWKPIQSGLQEETDSEAVLRISECDPKRILPEAFRLTQPLSPHLSSRLDGISIEIESLLPPKLDNMIIETAGGVFAPFNNDLFQIDLMMMWNLPVILAARSSLGTINHTLLTIEAFRARDIELEGVVMIGEPNEENEKAVAHYGKTEIIGRIPIISNLNKQNLQATYTEHFGDRLASIR